jgi:membrane-associated phospholipid phosphatase
MKIRKAAIHLLFAPLLFFASFNLSAQESDSVTQVIAKKFYSLPRPTIKNYLSAKSLIVPTAMVGYGFTALNNGQLQKLNENICEEVVEDCSGFNTKVDDYLKFAPAASVYLLDLAGVKARHKILDRTIILALSTILSEQLVTTLKHGTHQLRPDGSTYNSFPSGHTTTAFIGAELMNQELGWRSPWYSVAGYSMASATALLRIMNNRHWLSDVITGAGIGMLTTKFAYWLYSKWENRKLSKQLLYY